jgi:hypothetical protein
MNKAVGAAKIDKSLEAEIARTCSALADGGTAVVRFDWWRLVHRVLSHPPKQCAEIVGRHFAKLTASSMNFTGCARR